MNLWGILLACTWSKTAFFFSCQSGEKKVKQKFVKSHPTHSTLLKQSSIRLGLVRPPNAKAAVSLPRGRTECDDAWTDSDKESKVEKILPYFVYSKKKEALQWFKFRVWWAVELKGKDRKKVTRWEIWKKNTTLIRCQIHDLKTPAFFMISLKKCLLKAWRKLSCANRAATVKRRSRPNQFGWMSVCGRSCRSIRGFRLWTSE